MSMQIDEGNRLSGVDTVMTQEQMIKRDMIKEHPCVKIMFLS